MKPQAGVARLSDIQQLRADTPTTVQRPVSFLLMHRSMTVSPEISLRQRKIRPRHHWPWGICPKLRRYTQIAVLALVIAGGGAHAAITEPRLALMRVTAYQGASGRVTLTLEGTFSFADAVQLAIPLNVTVVQGALGARFDLAGNVFTSQNNGTEQAAPGPGIVDIAEKKITLVLPAGFTSGSATVQVIANFDGKPIASNHLTVSL